MARNFTRRRAIAIMAATVGLPLVARAQSNTRAVTWRGVALGAPATLIVHHEDPREAERLVGLATAEVERLEQVFSLYRPDSTLVELNRVGALVAPPPELISLLELCGELWRATGGAFDPTVQPLWALYRDHFAAGTGVDGPRMDELSKALQSVDFGKVRISDDLVVLGGKGAGLTLNGIAQGFITDLVVELLKTNGITSTLVDMGEVRGVGDRPDGTPWRVALAQSEAYGRADAVIEITDRAVATSSATGYCFDDAGRYGHILDPKRGICAARYSRVSVIADTAAVADGLSTAFSLMTLEEIRKSVAQGKDIIADIASPSLGAVRIVA